ncbi:MAG: hypothetical protein HOV87_12160 [Catenulispora sp.]|nr:hypothetical protein [Catenulispora sp.]NUT39999.1 hypothetical protein [Thermoactinospora sp.]
MSEEQGEEFWRTSITMPTSLADYAKSKADGGKYPSFSAYLASLVERDRRRDVAHQRLAEFGYTGAMAPTEAGRARARAALEAHKDRRRRAAGGTGQQAA